jgi:hypothetical protein
MSKLQIFLMAKKLDITEDEAEGVLEKAKKKATKSLSGKSSGPRYWKKVDEHARKIVFDKRKEK